MLHRIVKNIKNKKWLKQAVLLTLSFMAMPVLWAAGPPAPSSINDPLVLALVILILLLLLVIGLLANVLLGAAMVQHEKEKNTNPAKPTVAMLTGLVLFSSSLMAQDTGASVAVSFGNLSATTFYLMIGVISVELLVILFMLLQVRAILRKDKKQTLKDAIASSDIIAKPSTSWWDRFNSFRPAEQEADIDLGHEYDGIRELDNRLPPWWLYGFYITIIFAGVYLYRYHVAHAAPLSAEELVIATKKAEQQQAEYLKNAANLVDENTVKILTDVGAIASGKNLYDLNCVACHGKAGEGGVGPNMTDEYWIHGGSVHDIFKSIKYGWQEKGMKSWKDDFTASQMAQLASFLLTLKGTHPPNAKAPQGDLYNGAIQNTDTSSIAVESVLVK